MNFKDWWQIQFIISTDNSGVNYIKEVDTMANRNTGFSRSILNKISFLVMIFLFCGVAAETSSVNAESKLDQEPISSSAVKIVPDLPPSSYPHISQKKNEPDTNTVETSYPPDIIRVSVDSAGNQANGDSWHSSISQEGRYVAFISYASNLVAGDSNGLADVFVHDLVTGITEIVSVSSSGEQIYPISPSHDPSVYSPNISADGRFIAFSSDADNLVPGDTNSSYDVFLRDLQRGTTTRVSISSTGEQANDYSSYPSISADGRYIAFISKATNLVPDDLNNEMDVFVHDLQTEATTRVSVNSSGDEANLNSDVPFITSDGRYITFASAASNFFAGDTPNTFDGFLHDMQTGSTKHLPIPWPGGISGNGKYIVYENGNGVYSYDVEANVTSLISPCSYYSTSPTISYDGNLIAYASSCTSLVPGDTNSQYDIFVHDRTSGKTQRYPVDNAGFQGNYGSAYPSISSDGSTIEFSSYSDNLVEGDTNNAADIFVVRYRPYLLNSEITGDGTVTSTPTGIDCGILCSYYFEKNESVSLAATASTGSAFKGWSWGGAIASTANPFNISMNADKSITANFQLEEYTLAVTSDHGTVTKSPDQATYHYGDVVQLTAVADPTYTFANWSDAATGFSNPLSITIQGNTTLTAHYLQNAHLLTITSDRGTVRKNPDQAVYLEGAVVQITAIPDPGARFDLWSGAIYGPQNPANITIHGDTSVTASYSLLEYTLTITSDHGTVTREPDQPTYHYGDVVHLTASPDPDFSFTNWSGDAASTTNSLDLTIYGNTALTASYSLNSYSLSVIKTGNGSGTVTSVPIGIDCGDSCSNRFTAGTTITLSETPASTSLFQSWAGGCTGADTCTVELHSDITITADFLTYRLYIPAVAKPVPPPGPFNKTSPADGSTGVSKLPTLYWSSSATATNYEYCIDTTNNSTCDSSWISVGMYLNATPIGLTPSTTYYWQVRSRNAGVVTYANNGNWYSFSTRWGPKPGFWWDNTTGTYFFVTPDQVIVREFSIYVYIEDCYDGWISRTYPAGDVNISSDNTFTFGGPLYASGTFDLETTAHGYMGLSHFGPLCDYYWSGGPFNWSAVWLDNTQPSAAELRALEANVRQVLRGTNPPIFFTPDKK
jgi:hypothetical protein